MHYTRLAGFLSLTLALVLMAGCGGKPAATTADSGQGDAATTPVDEPANTGEFAPSEFTGSAWPDGKRAHPVAWKLVLKAADGRTLAEQKSFLWEKPGK